MLPPERARLYASTEARQNHDGAAVSKTVALRPLWSTLHDRGRRERATRTAGRLPGHRRVRSTPAEAIADVAHQLPDGCPVQPQAPSPHRPKPERPCTDDPSRTGCPFSASAEPSPAEARKNPAPTNPGRGARSAPNARSTAAEAEEDVTSDESRTGVWSSPRHTLRGRNREGSHKAASGRVPGRHRARTSAAEAEEAVTRAAPGRCPVGAARRPPRPKPKKTLPDEFRTCPRSRSPSSRSQRTATRRDVDTGRRRGHAPEAEAPKALALDHPTPARAVPLPATEAVGVHRIQPTWKSTSIMRP
jgi:pyruvate/2-oxoglutarate dehydrogenase complex dihydrolipoamide acyltransferase (E2) component